MERRHTRLYSSLLASAGFAALVLHPSRGMAQLLGSAQSFAILGGSSVTAAGTGSVISGDVGVSPGTSITGFPPATVVPPFSVHVNDGPAVAAQSAVTALYVSLLPGSCSMPSVPQLSGATFTPGTYCFSSTADLAATGNLTLDGAGTYIFQVGSGLTANVDSTVTLLNGADPCDVFWQVTSAATLNGDNFVGNVVAQAGVTVGVDATLAGRALTTAAGAVTMAGTNTVGGCSGVAIATATAANTPTQIPTQTPTVTPTDTPPNTPTAIPTGTPTQTPADSQTATATDTRTSTATATSTPIVVDFGDAPDTPYTTLLANDGARHALGSNIYLGICVDAEADGQPSVMADGDDNATATTTFGICAVPGDDEDGVILPSNLITGTNVLVDVIANAACLLSAWMDWNGDGDWNDVSEQVFTNQLITAGLNNLLLSVPSGATTGAIFVRFRCSTQPDLAVTGQASDGEVEDYKVSVVSPTTTPTNTPTDTSTSVPFDTPTNTPTPVDVCVEPPLGPAQDTNVFVIGTANLHNSDVHGRMTICGNAIMQNYSVGSALIGLQDALRVGGNLTYITGTIYGNTVASGTASMTSVTSANGGSVINASVLECATANAELLALSGQYGALQPNGTVSFQFGVITLTGSDSSTNIFALNAGQLGTANTLQISVPPGSSVLLNISGTTVTWQQMGIFLNGVDESQVLYNFREATSLVINGISVRGSVLAPKAAVQFNNGQVNGTLVAASLSGFGQAHQVEFDGCLGPQPAFGPSPTPTSNVPATSTYTRTQTSTAAPTDTPAPPTATGTVTAPVTATGTPTPTEPTATPTTTEPPPPPTLTSTPTATPCPNNPLGDAAEFNVFACGNANLSNSDIEGRIGVAGDASLANYGIGSSLPPSNGGRDDLIAGGNLTYNSGQMFAGNAVYGGTANVNHVGFPSGSLIQGMPGSFASKCSDLQMLSDNLCTLPGSTLASSGNLQFSGAHPTLNVFYVGAASVANAHSIQISAPANASVVINVTGGPAQIAHLGMMISGTDRNHVLWNFCDATQLTIRGVAVEGSVLAPYTDVIFDNGQVNGTLITKDLSGGGESHDHRFSGCGL